MTVPNSITIAITGKGGAGKTTIAYLLAKYMASLNLHPLLIDADPTMSHLTRMLAISNPTTIEQIRTDLIKTAATGSAGEKEYLAAHLDEIVDKSIISRDDFSLIVMGQPQSAGCFCPSNSLLRRIIESISAKFQLVLIDCEAGMEQIHRNVISTINYLIVIINPSYRSIETANQILNSAKKFVQFQKAGIILNRAKEGDFAALGSKFKDLNVPMLGIIPEDSLIEKFELQGKGLDILPHDRECFKNIAIIAKKLGIA